MSLYPILLSIAAFASTFLGGLLATRYRDQLGRFAAFSAGVLIAVPLFDLLPEAFRLATQANVPLENVMYLTALGFIFLYVLERYFSVHRVCEDGVCRNVRHARGGLLGAAELSAHSFVDGFAIGLGFQADVTVGIIITVAVICHDFADGINTVTVMMNSGNSVRSSLRMLLLDAIAPVLGAASTLLIVAPERVLIYILPFFAGGFVYLGASDLLPEAHESNPPAVSLVLSLAGFLLIFVVTRLLNV